MKPKQLPKEIVELLLPRLSDEFKAFYFYRAAENWCKNVGFEKAAEYFAAESADELTHAKLIEKYLVDWNVTPQIPKSEVPQLEFKGLVELIEEAYKIEYALYEEYEDTSGKVFKQGDFCTFDFLQQLRSIQTKSVAEYSDMLNILDGIDRTNKFYLEELQKKLF